ncbi:MAG TPA: Gfo/Idh/MocA family oxidoreductase [Polyangiaceae bacterium]|nr:Gfo/Idh/MocA family oxidoreductase [Polyangiaceae bacterium]
MQTKLRFGVIGTGGIAGDFCQALRGSKRCEVVSAVGSTPEKGADFARRFDLPRAARSLSELLGDASVDAVYVATPHPLHEAQALSCIEAGKHVLCEKPLTLDAATSERVIAAARRRSVFLLEGYMYRCHPLLAALLERLKRGDIGELRHIRADFGFRVARDPEQRLFNLALGGGGILDVGGYCTSFARLLAGVVTGKPFAEPVSFEAVGFKGPTGADEHSSAILRFESGLTAALTCAVHHRVGTETVLYGESGRIVLPDPWIPQGVRQSLETSFQVLREGQPVEVVTMRTEQPTYALQAELVASALPALEAPWPAMSWADTLGNMRALDRWRACIGR